MIWNGFKLVPWHDAAWCFVPSSRGPLLMVRSKSGEKTTWDVKKPVVNHWTNYLLSGLAGFLPPKILPTNLPYKSTMNYSFIVGTYTSPIDPKYVSSRSKGTSLSSFQKKKNRRSCGCFCPPSNGDTIRSTKLFVSIQKTHTRWGPDQLSVGLYL